MLHKLGKIAMRTVIGAAAGALMMVLGGQVLGLMAASCTVACDPLVAGSMGAFTGGIAASVVDFGAYKPG